jgi:hypothetical protein
MVDVVETPKRKRGRPKKRKNSEESDKSSPLTKSPRSDSLSPTKTTTLADRLDQLNVSKPTNKFRSARRALAENSNLKLPGSVYINLKFKNLNVISN